MTTNRDSLGRFTPGNTIAALGWAGLVRRRFAGDQVAAKAWVGQVGRWAYAKQFVGAQTSMMAMRFATCFAHPGQPEEFVAEYARRFDFTLDDVIELSF